MEKVVVCWYKKPNALCRLICFSWAAGGTSEFAVWGKLFNSSVEVCSIRLPGRECRANEPFAKDMADVVNEVTSALLKKLQEKPFAFFGHSFGSYVSFAVALHLKEKYGLEPIHLFTSGAHAPVSKALLPMKSINMYDVQDEDIVRCIELLGGTYSEHLQNEKCRKHLLVALREDLRVLQTFSFEKPEGSTPFSCDVTSFNGSEDKPYYLEAWHDLTSGDVFLYKLPGCHFYLLEPANEIFLIKHITRCIENAGL
ncbi:S-acyl fatty acid synthase thioesterase, medium chain [Nipponia nippon]|uniref:S-acyl fatty acid synthase thioesterase, medium chain n=1 Tax=Nipponia nippon TaxID=128390 RepID=A0A091UQN8_NIPNI|nr:PREDICTED: S-acyl fatty acid synthase thioesterase, medium chain [Nipponia nippon]KFQ92707.1 S-acyl fatty acid synthase thioesterase, medium chain [Nipponia nippon]